METINDLVGFKDLKIIQNTEWFNFSLDSVLLANFVTINSRVKKIIDLGTGNAPIPLILSTKTKAHIYGIEIQSSVYDLALKSIKINNLEEQITIINKDIKEINDDFQSDSYDVITCNPPFFKNNNNSIINQNDHKTIARHEVMMTIDDILKISRKLLKNNGYLGIVHRPERLVEILEKMKNYNIEPKRIQFVYPKRNGNCNNILIEGVKNGKSGLKILPPLIIHENNGQYTKEVLMMFGSDINEAEKL